MKKVLLTSIVMVVLFITACNSGNKQNKDAAKEPLKGNISISGAFALYPIAVKWSEEFMKLNPEVKIDISAGGAGKGMTDVLSGMVTLGMVSRTVSDEEKTKGAWIIPVTKDAVVPIISFDNPYIQQIVRYGVKKDILNDVFITGDIKNWGQVLKIKKINAPIKVFTRSDACGAAEVWANYFGKKQDDLKGVRVYGDPGLAEAVRKEKLSVGFCNIAFAYNAVTKLKNEGLYILPIDFNGNGQIDDNESFYDTMDQLDKAIAEGKYPSPPARDLYFVSKGKPADRLTIEFLKWVLTDGQKYVPETGFVKLTDQKMLDALKSLQ